MIYVYEFQNTEWNRQLLQCASEAGLEWTAQQCTGIRAQKLRERLSAWLLLRYALREEYGITELADLEIYRTEKGKPCSAAYPELSFNLSHCEQACACILSGENAGIDVERMFPFRASLAKKICTREEWEILQHCGEARQAEALRLLWSMKESFVKRDGRGLGYGMERVQLAPHLEAYLRRKSGAGGGLMRFAPAAVDDEGEAEYLVLQKEAYTLAACGRDLPGQIRRVKEAELLTRA